MWFDTGLNVSYVGQIDVEAVTWKELTVRDLRVVEGVMAQVSGMGGKGFVF